MRVLITDTFSSEIVGFARQHKINRVCVLTDEVLKPETEKLTVETVPPELWKPLVEEIISENIEAVYLWVSDIRLLLRICKEILVKFPQTYIIYNGEII